MQQTAETDVEESEFMTTGLSSARVVDSLRYTWFAPTSFVSWPSC